VDIRKESMEVLPTPHFSCGGIKIGLNSASILEGHYAGGEAGGGIHGANRLGANSFFDLQVFGTRAGQSAGEYALKNKTRPNIEQVEKSVEKLAEPLVRKEGTGPISIRKKVQKLMYQNVGIMRNEKGLKESIKVFEEMGQKELPRIKVSSNRIFNYERAESIKVRNMVRAALVIARSALFREESRGVHFREDFPKKDKNWLLNVNAKTMDCSFKIAPMIILFPQQLRSYI